MPYILQTPCKHTDCECLATLNSEDGIIAFQTKDLKLLKLWMESN
jgi:hypothetical protein